MSRGSLAAVSRWVAPDLGDMRQYIGSRFPVSSHVLPVATAFVCLYVVYSHLAALYVWSARAIGGLVTFVLLFLQLRMVDDLIDLEGDAAVSGMPDAKVRIRRSGIVAGFGLSVVAVVLLNWGGRSLFVAAVATTTMIVTPFGLRRLVAPGAPVRALTTGSPVRDGLLAPWYEGVHLVILLYVYFVWASVAQQSLPAAVVLWTTGAFWTAYEFWKYSRYLTRPTWRPYGLDWRQARFVLVGVLGLSLVCQVMIGAAAAFPRSYLVYAAAITVFFTTWVLAASPKTTDTVRSQGMNGLVGYVFVGALEVGLLLAILLSRRGP